MPISPYYFKNRQRGMALVSLAGPVTQLHPGDRLHLHPERRQPLPGWVRLESALPAHSRSTWCLGLFNLMPIPPLDGSECCGAVLPQKAYEKWADMDQYGMILVLVFMRCSLGSVRAAFLMGNRGLGETPFSD